MSTFEETRWTGSKSTNQAVFAERTSELPTLNLIQEWPPSIRLDAFYSVAAQNVKESNMELHLNYACVQRFVL